MSQLSFSIFIMKTLKPNISITVFEERKVNISISFFFFCLAYSPAAYYKASSLQPWYLYQALQIKKPPFSKSSAAITYLDSYCWLLPPAFTAAKGGAGQNVRRRARKRKSRNKGSSFLPPPHTLATAPAGTVPSSQCIQKTRLSLVRKETCYGHGPWP